MKVIDFSVIDWLWIGSNAIWVLGLAIAVAGLSFRAAQDGYRQAWNGTSVRLGLLLTGVGLAACRDFLPERVLWGLASLAVVLWPARSGLQTKGSRDDGP